MRLLSPILSRVIYPSIGQLGCFRYGLRPQHVSVITYHGVLPDGYKSSDPFLDSTLVTAKNFRSQLRLLKSDYNVISCEHFREWLDECTQLPPRAVLLTCDDGLMNHLTEMVPILREEGLSCLFFVTGGSCSEAVSMLWHVELYLMLVNSTRQDLDFCYQGIQVQDSSKNPRDRPTLWLRLLQALSRVRADARRAFLDEFAFELGLEPNWTLPYLHDPVLCRRFALLRKSQLCQLYEAGMTIGAHSVSHPRLSEPPAKLAQAEISDSRQLLHAFGQPAWAFAYPFGERTSAGEREFALVRQAGFRCAFMNTGGPLSAASPPFALPRVHISGDMGLREFEAHVTGVHDQVRSWFSWQSYPKFATCQSGGDACA